MAASWFSTFFEKALVSRVNRRMDIRIVRLDRSTDDVLMCFGSGVALDGPLLCASADRRATALFRFAGLRVRMRLPAMITDPAQVARYFAR